MKKVKFTFSRPNAETNWYAVSSETKSAAFNEYNAFVSDNATSLNTFVQDQNNVGVEIVFTDELYTQFDELYQSASVEISQYNSSHGITFLKEVIDV